MRPGNSSKPVRPIDVRKSVRPVNSNKPVCPVDICKSVRPVDVCKSACLIDVRKSFFVDYWRHVILILIVLFFAVFVNTSAFNRAIPYMTIFINIHITYLTFTKFFKCSYVILIDCFLFIVGRLFRYLFLWIFSIFKHFFKLSLIISLPEKCPNTELFIVSVFLYLDWIQENTDQK